MLLTSRNVVYYMLDRGLVTHESVVDGDLMVADTSRRNRNFKVIRKRHPGYFVKQIQNWDPQAIATLSREASCYWLAQSDPNFTALAALMPRFHAYDPGRHVLVVDLLPDGEDLSSYHRRLGEFPVDAGRLVGRVLGTYHSHFGPKQKLGIPSGMFPQMVPWILSIHQHAAMPANQMSGANTQLLAIIQREPDFGPALDALRNEWRTESLIHGDMKWDNCILYPTNGDDKLNLKVVDWEMADVGDPCWDVGAIFQAYLVFWIFSMPVAPGATPDQLLERAQYPIEAMQPSIHAFWNAYTDRMGVSGDASRSLLRRSVKYGAARMIQTAYESMYMSSQISATTICLLQVSINILTNFDDAIRDLLDL